jgi:SAM-dependent methyltransferase
MNPVSPADGLAALRPLMAATATTLSPTAFHAAVDRAFHDAEASEYDTLHAAMWASLPQQFALLADDVLSRPGLELPDRLIAADIGCGTGQSAAALLASPLGPRITHIDLIDSSPAMLANAAARARSWPVSYALHKGGFEVLPRRDYDLVLVCSVLHHLPVPALFLADVRDRQPAGGIFLHVQDPNADALLDPEAMARQQEYHRLTRSRIPPPLQRLSPRRVLGRLRRQLTGQRAYIDAANERLLADGVIARRMTPAEFWSVTDIHVPGLPYSSGAGISLEAIRQSLGDYSLLSARSYAFFGEEYFALPDALRAQEQRLIEARAMNGHRLAGAWRKN